MKINKRYSFDKLYVPFFFGIKEFCIYGKKIKTDYKLITSKHLFMVSKLRFFKKGTARVKIEVVRWGDNKYYKR